MLLFRSEPDTLTIPPVYTIYMRRFPHRQLLLLRFRLPLYSNKQSCVSILLYDLKIYICLQVKFYQRLTLYLLFLFLLKVLFWPFEFPFHVFQDAPLESPVPAAMPYQQKINILTSANKNYNSD